MTIKAAVTKYRDQILHNAGIETKVNMRKRVKRQRTIETNSFNFNTQSATFAKR